MLKVIDANNYIRRLIEADASGLPMRNLLTEIKSSKDVWVFVWDGRNGNERRRKLYPEYKMKRKLPTEDIWRAMDLFREVLRHSKAIQVTVPEYDADDVIASLVQNYVQQVPIEIHSTDRDLTALGVHVVGCINPKAPPELIRLYKATVGDPSDNIPGIKGFGEKAWASCDKDELLEWYTRGVTLACSDPEVISEAFSIGKAHTNWLIENEQLARTFYDIVGFFPPSLELIERYTTTGIPNDTEVSSILRSFLL